MNNNIKKKPIFLEIIFYLVSSVIIRILQLIWIDELGLNYPPMLTFVACMGCGIGLIYFAYERWADLPFFYGTSQRGGSNANSFIVLAFGVALFPISNFKYALIAVVMAFLMYILALIIPTKAK